MTTKIEIGTVVILNSGGPKMTVVGHETTMDLKWRGSLSCAYFA